MNVSRIAIDLTPFVYARAPGYNEYIMSLLDGFIANSDPNFKLTLLVRRDQKNIFCKFEDIFEIRYINLASVYARVIWQNLVMPFYDFDLFLFTGNFAPVFINKKYIVVVHDLNFLIFPSNFGFISLLYRKFVTARSVIRSSACVAISALVAEDVVKNYGKDSVVIYNPVRIGRFMKKTKSNFELKEKLIVCASSLAQHKNVLAAYQAALRIVNDYPDIFFAFIGNWSPELFLITEENSNIKILGYVSDEEKNCIFNSASAILSPSLFEGFGMPYVEAMMLNKCLICSDIPISKEICGGYPIFIESPYCVDDIYCAIKTAVIANFPVIFSPNLIKFDPKQVAKSYIQLFQFSLGR